MDNMAANTVESSSSPAPPAGDAPAPSAPDLSEPVPELTPESVHRSPIEGSTPLSEEQDEHAAVSLPPTSESSTTSASAPTSASESRPPYEQGPTTDSERISSIEPEVLQAIPSLEPAAPATDSEALSVESEIPAANSKTEDHGSEAQDVEAKPPFALTDDAPAAPKPAAPTGPPTPFRPALLLIDIQEDFCPPNGALAVPDGRAIIPVANALLALPGFVFTAATLDSHPPTHVSFAANHAGAAPFTSFATIANPLNAAETYRSRLWPVHCVAGTPGHALAAGLAARRVRQVVLKGTDPRVEMYSAFRAPLRAPPLPSAESALAGALRACGATDVFVAGLAGDYCVRASALDCAEDGWRTYVVEEGTRCVGGKAAWEEVRAELEGRGVRVVSVDGPELAWVRARAAE